MEQYTIQSYFKSLCNSFYIAYAEVKRLERESKETDSRPEVETLEAIEKVLATMKNTEDPAHKYIYFKYTEAELEKEKARLDEIVLYKDQKSKSLGKEINVWSERLWNLKNTIFKVLSQISSNNQKIIVTTKEEVYALMFVYRSEGLINVLNTEEQYLTSFPKEDKVCSSFLEFYLTDNKKEMKKFCSENI